MVQILRSNTETISRSGKPLEIIKLREGLDDVRVVIDCIYHAAEKPKKRDRQPQTTHWLHIAKVIVQNSRTNGWEYGDPPSF